jgi:hypothetical protein
MRGRARAHAHARPRIAVLVAVSASLAVIAFPSLVAGKSSNSKGSTKKSTVALATGAVAATSAPCANNTHATGGGLAVTTGWDPATKVGTQTEPQTSFPPGKGKWRAGASSLKNEAAANLTTYTRCEKNSFGKTSKISGAVAIQPGTGQTLLAACPANTHVLSGGYSVNPAFDSNAQAGTTSHMIIQQSRRTSTRTWSVSAANPGQPAAQLTAYALCEKNNGASVSEASGFASVPNNSRHSVSAKCGNNKHVIGGGFAVTPLLTSSASPVIDTSMPSGSQTWVVAGYVQGGSPGASITAYAYCKSNKPPS